MKFQIDKISIRTRVQAATFIIIIIQLFVSAGDASSQFSASAAGVITTAASLDATVTNVYFLQIEADDTGGTALTGTTTLIVYLDDDSKCSGAVGLSGSLISSFVIFLVYKML